MRIITFVIFPLTESINISSWIFIFSPPLLTFYRLAKFNKNGFRNQYLLFFCTKDLGIVGHTKQLRNDRSRIKTTKLLYDTCLNSLLHGSLIKVVGVPPGGAWFRSGREQFSCNTLERGYRGFFADFQKT